MSEGFRKKFQLVSLEPRLLFSADTALLPVDGGALATETDEVLEVSLNPVAESHVEGANESLRHEVVFVDSSVENAQLFIDDLIANQDASRYLDVVTLDADSDGIVQISDYLAYQQGINAVHIVSHGTPGETALGNALLNLETLENYTDQFEAWQNSFSEDADVLFYGCNLAESPNGQALIDNLALLTHADVAASEDLTGHVNKGGDWDLEYQKGDVETAVAFGIDAQETWQGSLAAPVASPNSVVTTEGNPYNFSSLDFTFTDADGDALVSATLTNLNLAGGTLIHSGSTSVAEGSTLSVAEMNSLIYTPLAETVGLPLATFDFTVNDTETGTVPALMSIDVKDPPEVDNSTLVLAKGQSTVLTSGMLEAKDLDTPPASLTYTITFVAGGQFEFATAPGSGIVNFTQQQIDDGDVVFVDDGDAILPAFSFEVSDGEFTTGPVDGQAVFFNDAVWLSTVSDVSGSTVNGLSDWTNKDFLQMGDPGFGLEPGITNGTFSMVFSLENFTSDAVRLTSLHVVTTQIDIGDTNKVSLEPGDILFTLNGGKPDLGGVTVDKVDVVRFRPDTAGDYSSGTFEIVLDAPVSPPLGQDLGGVSLIEKDTRIGDFEVEAGNFLLVETKGNEQVIHYYEVLNAGEGTTLGNLTTLVNGADLNIGTAEIMSIHLVSDVLDIGGALLSPGEILLSLDTDKTGADLFAGIEVTVNEVVALDFLTVTAGATSTSTVSSARIIFEGDDASFTETIDSFSLTSVDPLSFNEAPVANDDGSAATPINTPEDTAVFIDVTANDTDSDGTIDPTTVTVDPAANGTLSVDPVTGVVEYTPNLNFVGTDSFTYKARDNQGALSNSATVYINVTAVNDPPVGGYLIANEIPAAQIDQSLDGSGMVTITWKATDVELNDVTLHSFEYSTDGSTWQAPSTGDSSPALSAGWNDSRASFADFTSAPDYSFTFDTQNPDVNLDDQTWSTLYVRFVLNDGTNDSAPVVSVPFFQDNENPTATITGALYTYGTPEGVLTFSGADYLTVESPAGSDVKDYLDWDKLVIQVVSGATTTDVTFSLTDVVSAVVSSDTQLTITLTEAKTISLEGTSGFGSAGGADRFFVTSGFLRDAFRNAATTDGNILTAPTAINATESWTEDTLHPFSNAILTADPDGDALTVTLTLSDPFAGSLNVGSIGSATSTFDQPTGVWEATGDVDDINELLKALEFSPATNYNSDFTIATSVDDGAYPPQNGTITMTATPVDDPVAIGGDLSGSGDEDGGAITGTLTAADAADGLTDGSYFTIEAGDEASNGSASINPSSGLWSYTPNADYNGSDSFTVTITDDDGNTATQVISITVNAVVDIADDTQTVLEDGDVTTGLLANDSFENVGRTISSVTQGANGSVTIVDAVAGTVRYTPNPDFNGSDSYTYTVTSGGVTETATVNVTINQVDDPVTLGGDLSGSGDEDGGAITGTLTASDAADGLTDGSYFTIEAGDEASNGSASINPSSGLWSYTPNADYNGSDSFTVTITDDDGNSVTQAIDISVTAVADIVADTETTDEDTAVITNVLANDTFEGTPVITAVTQGFNGTVAIVDANLGTVSYTPDANFYGSDSYTYTVTSGGVTETVSVDVIVDPVNDPTVVTGGTGGSGAEDGGAITGTLTATDADGLSDGTVFTVTGAASNGSASIDPDTGDWSYTPNADYNGPDSFTVTITDDDGNSVTQAIDISVTAVADIVADTETTDEDTAVITNVLANDTFEGTPVITAVTQGFNGIVAIVDANLGTVSYTPDANFYGSDSYTYTVTSGGVTETVSVDVTVDPVNDQPSTNDDTLDAIEDNQLAIVPATTLLANDADPDFDSLVLQSFGQPDHGSLSLDSATGSLIYKPDNNFFGNDTFNYTISDGMGGFADGVALIIVAPVGDTPQVGNATVTSGVMSDPIVITPHASDGPEITHFRISGITGGTLYLANGTTGINNGDFITAAQGQAGVRFVSDGPSGSFQVESSQDGASVALQSGKATSTIDVLAPPETPVSEVTETLEEEPVTEEPEPEEEPVEEAEAPVETPPVEEDSVEQVQGEVESLHMNLQKAKPVFSRLSDVENLKNTEDGGSTAHSFRISLDGNTFDSFRNALNELDVSTLSREAYELVRNSLDDLKEEFEEDVIFDQVIVGSAAASTIGLSAGYVVWMLKGGSLLASVLSSIPAWQLADPLSILAGNRDEEEDEETLEKIIEDGAKDDDTPENSETDEP